MARPTQSVNDMAAVGFLLLLALCQRGLQHFANVTQVFQSFLDIGQSVFDQALHGSAFGG